MLEHQATFTIPLSLSFYTAFQEFYAPDISNGAHCINTKTENSFTAMTWSYGDRVVQEHYTMDVLIVGY